MTLKEKLAARVASTTSSTPPAPVLAQGINPPDAAKPDAVVKYQPVPQGEEMGRRLEQPIELGAPPNPIQEVIDAVVEKAADERLTLYIDCVPTFGVGEIPDIGARVSNVGKEIAAKHGVVDVRQVKFGEGTAELVAWFKSNIPKGPWTCSSVGLSGLVAEALAPHASMVVRGLR